MVTIQFRHPEWGVALLVDVHTVPRVHEVVSVEFDPGEPCRYLVSTVEHEIDSIDPPLLPGPCRRGRSGYVVVGLIDLDEVSHGAPRAATDDG
jgi:hypothetical protein